MSSFIEQSRSLLFTTPDTVCMERANLVSEAYRMNESEPIPMRRAQALEHILAHMSLDLDTNPIFVGNTSSRPRAWMLLPEYGFEIPGQVLIENPHLAGLLDGDAIPPELRQYWQGRSFGGGSGWGHLAVSNARLLAQGLDGIIASVEACGAGGQDEASVYRRAMVVACRAVIDWAERYASAAATAAQDIVDPLRAAALRRAAAACRQVPAKPARDLFEALQSLVLVHLAIHLEGHGYSVSPGRLDQLLEPYYRNEPDAVDLIAAFLLKLTANSVFGSHSKTQSITLGGVDPAGKDASNRLTLLILEACELARTPDPIVFLRWHPELSAEVKEKAICMLAEGFSMPLLVGDEQTIQSLIHAGVKPQDAVDFCIIGCNELGIPGRLIWNAVAFPEAALLRETIVDPHFPEPADMPALLDGLQARGLDFLRHALADHRAFLRRSTQVVPTPFTSALMDGCLEAGKDLLEGMPYSITNLRSSGFTNTVNGLSAIQEVSFARIASQPPALHASKGRRQSHPVSAQTLGGGAPASWMDLRRVLLSNFEDCEPVRRQLLRAPKWGNDDERADGWALAWLERRERVRRALQEESGLSLAFEIVVRSLHHLEGSQLGATPDGRRAGEPLADSVGAQVGTARRGPTALLSSICKMQPAWDWMGGYNLNLTLPYSAWRSPEMQPRLLSMVEAFFREGGQELQIACLDAVRLHKARAHPEKYPDLMVRIAGFNARFVDLAEVEQLELIERAEACV